MVKQNLPAMQETWVESLSEKDPWRREWQPTPVFWPREFHGQRSLEGYSPWDRKESDTTERPTLSFSSLWQVYWSRENALTINRDFTESNQRM